jgi:hypothetical protein
MRPSKKPPPDTVGNVLGRIGMLKSRARAAASTDVREGGDLEKATQRRMREAAPELENLQRRLAKARKVEKDGGAVSGVEPEDEPKKPSRKPSRRRRRTPGDDLLDQLDSL